MGWETLLLISAGGGALYAVAGYLKNRKEGEPFSCGKFFGTALIGALGGLAKWVPVAGDALAGAGSAAITKTVTQALTPRRLP